MNGVTLLRTSKDFVTLDVNGETQKLTLERVKIGEKSNSDIIVRATPKNQQSSNLKFKLKSGDILTRVGPVMLNTGRPNIKDMRNLIETGAAQDFEVIRDGSPVTIRIGQ